ncbi:MAG TPA: DUF4251 domain-containing protein [Puia sp.]|nr:DUF4251 domain-containing protein [Puia sp.]
MKLPSYLSGILMLTSLLAGSLAVHAQDTKKDKDAEKIVQVRNLVDSQNYIFIAQSASPMSGRLRQLTPDYDLKITKSSIVSYLPYFGRAYTAPLDPSKGGIQFTSKDFEYTATPRAKGGWDVLIKPKDYRDVQQMSLSISSTGYATLQVTSTSRQPISFNGYIRAPKKRR